MYLKLLFWNECWITLIQRAAGFFSEHLWLNLWKISIHHSYLAALEIFFSGFFFQALRLFFINYPGIFIIFIVLISPLILTISDLFFFSGFFNIW